MDGSPHAASMAFTLESSLAAQKKPPQNNSLPDIPSSKPRDRRFARGLSRQHSTNTMKIQIKNRFIESILFECEAPDGLESGMHMRYALEKASNTNANLRGANLRGANLRGANLRDADLSDADLSDADLSDADLRDANLRYANLSDANLSDADLSDADLRGANLIGADLHGANLRDGEKLVGDRPVFQIGPIGSRCDYFVAYITDCGLRFDAGCQRQITREKFEERLASTHGENKYAKEYRAALALIDVHAEIWTQKP